MGPDLHIHSTASDGTLAPEAIIECAARLGIPAIALTDHDTIAGVGPAQTAASSQNLIVIPAVELSTELGTRSIHILGYWIDYHDPVLNERLARQREFRLERAERIVEALRAWGISSLTMRDVRDAARGGAVGRSHIAQVLIRTGHASSIEDAFQRYLGEDAPCFVPKTVPTPAQAISWITEAGGVPVLAHPALNAVDDLIPELVDAGLGGIEAYHTECSPQQTVQYVQLAAEYGLLVTGGSDFHGNGRPTNKLGSANVPLTVLESLQAAAPSRFLGGAA